MPIPDEIIKAIIAAIGSGLFKKKPYMLHHWDAAKWASYGPFSARQCKKAKKALVVLGENPAMFCILRKGVPPPPGGPK